MLYLNHHNNGSAALSIQVIKSCSYYCPQLTLDTTYSPDCNQDCGLSSSFQVFQVMKSRERGGRKGSVPWEWAYDSTTMFSTWHKDLEEGHQGCSAS